MSILSPEYILKKAGEPIADLQFWTCHSVSMLISGYGGKGGVDIWNLRSRRSSMSIWSNAAMLSVHGFASGDLLTLDKEGNLLLVDINNGTPVNKLHLTVSNVAFCKAATWSPDNLSKHIVGVPGEAKSSVNIWNLNEKTITSHLVPNSRYKLGMPWCIKLLGQSRPVCLIGYEDGSILCWDVSERKVLSAADCLFSDPIMCFDACLMNDHSIVGAAGSVSTSLVKWNISLNVNNKGDGSDEHLFSVCHKHELINEGLSSLKIRQDQKILATGGWDNKTRIFSWKTLKPLAILEYHCGSVQSLDFSDNKLLACGSADHRISIWKIFDT